MALIAISYNGNPRLRYSREQPQPREISLDPTAPGEPRPELPMGKQTLITVVCGTPRSPGRGSGLTVGSGLLQRALSSSPDSVALVHEWFSPWAVGGAEAVVRELDQLLAPHQLYALVDGESRRPESWLAGRSVTTSFIQRLPWGVRRVQIYLPLLPMAVEQLDLSGHGLVVSSSHLVAKGVLTGPDQLHVSYVHSPPRYAWDQMNVYLHRNALARGPLGPWIRCQLHQLRQWDHLSAQRVDVLVANSRFTARRIWRCWRRRSVVIHPPVAVERFHWQQSREDFYLCLGRLVAYKRVDLVVEAFNRCRLPLLVVGDGPEWGRLRRQAGPTVRMVGRRSSRQVEDLLARCRALVHAGVEDFGIAPVEAMAAGAPVIALGQGGLLDSVCCHSRDPSTATGLLFDRPCPRVLAEAVRHFEDQRLWQQLPAERLRRQAERFSAQRFRTRMKTRLDESWRRFQAGDLRAPQVP